MRWLNCEKIRLIFVVFVAVIVLGSIELVKGATIVVGPGADYDFDTIQAGIETANDGDEVIVASGEYVITKPITFRGKAITVISEAGPDETTIRMGTPADTNRGSVVVFENNETTDSILDGFTITGGGGSWLQDALYGGGILFNASSSTVSNCNIIQNNAKHGGGVFCASACSPILVDCVIAENSARLGMGGGIFPRSGASPSLYNCIIRDNSSTGTLFGSGGGGGVCLTENSSMTMNDCIITENYAGQAGGGVFCGGNSSSVTVRRCLIIDNVAGIGGGGLETWCQATAIVTNCVITGNTTEHGGGIICAAYGYQGNSVTVTNSIIWGNNASQGREIRVANPATFSISYSNVAIGQVGISVEGGTLKWGDGNIDADPLFADPNRDDFHLKSQAGRWDPNNHTWVCDDVTSPCIDRGDPNSPVAFEPDPNGGIINMGAYGGTPEASMSIGTLPPPPLPIAHWKLDETKGAIAHDSAGEIQADLFGDPIWHPTSGMVDGALMLDGVDDFVGTWNIPGLSVGKLSVFVWVKGGAPSQVVVSQWKGMNWLMADASQGYLKTDLKEVGDSAQSLVSDVTFTDGQWHRVGLTWDGTNRVLYVDDIAVASDTQTELEYSTMGLNIGCGPNETTGTFWSGLIDDVRIYNRAVRP